MKTFTRFLALLAATFLALAAFNASAQDARSSSSEPSVSQIYQAANSGDTAKADAMMAEVLKAHPNSAKAHYVAAELSAREGKTEAARSQLATAEKLAPGLPFAKPESVRALHNQLAGTARSSTPPATRQMGAPSDGATAAGGSYNAAPAPAQRSFPWGTLIVIGAIVLIGMMILRRRTAAMAAANNGYGPGAYGGQPGANGPVVYPPSGGVPPGFGQPGYGPGYGPGYPQQQPGMGSTIARGVGTGLAMGAGMVAAEEIGRRMFGHEHGGANAAAYNPNANTNAPSLDQLDDGMRRNMNSDMGGADFGVNDGGSWDDGGGGGDFGGGDAGGGNDW
jgi:uncharacterized protein